MTWSDGAAGPSKQDSLDALAATVARNRYIPKDDRLTKAAAALMQAFPEGKMRISTSGHINPDGSGRVMVCVTMEA
jgi:hypothetical protein